LASGYLGLGYRELKRRESVVVLAVVVSGAAATSTTKNGGGGARGGGGWGERILKGKEGGMVATSGGCDVEPPVCPAGMVISCE